MNTPNKLDLYKSLYSIRRTEEICADEYKNGTMRTPTHFGIGQEAVAVGVCAALDKGDYVYTHHRSHTHYLAQGGSLMGLIAELFGREDGCSRGRGGSVHLIDRDAGFMGSSPILGHSLALATGSALAFAMDGKKNIAVAFFGEGTFDEGSVWESLNFAAIKKLPVLFVCENNGYATESPLHVRRPMGTEFCQKATAFGVHSAQVDGNDVLKTYDAAQKAINSCRNGNGPSLIECMTYRWREHVGPQWDHEANRTYRSKDELDEWIKKCPVAKMAKLLIDEKIITVDDLHIINADIDSQILITKEKAFQSPWPKPESLFENV